MKGEGYYRYEGMRYLTAGVIVSDSAFLTMILYSGFYCSTKQSVWEAILYSNGFRIV